MEKYTKQQKLDAVKYVLEEGHSIAQAADHFDISKNPIEKWINLYKIHGEIGLESRDRVGRQSGFDDEFRLRVVRYIEEHNSSFTQTAALFMVDVVTVSKWWKKYQEGGQDALSKLRKPKRKDS